MRFYTIPEIKELSSYFNEEFIKSEDFRYVTFSSSITNIDLCSRKLMLFSEFKEKYKLNCNDYYDDYKNLYSLGESVHPDSNITDINETVSEVKMRYPIIILCNNNEKNDNVPEMIHFTELNYTLNHFDDESLKVIVIDKMIKPLSKKLLDSVAEYYHITDYDYTLYI